MKKTNILIVDNHKIIRKALRFLLSSKKEFNVVADVASKGEALQILQTNKIELLLTNIGKKKDGIYLAEEVKQAYPKTNVMMLTTYLEEELVLSSL